MEKPENPKNQLFLSVGDKMKAKWINCILVLCLLLAVVLIAVSLSVSPILRPPAIGAITRLNDGWTAHKNGSLIGNTDLPVRIEARGGDVVTITRTLPELPDGETFLRIRSALVSVKVTVDDTVVYYYGDPAQLSIKNGIGGAWNFIDISGLRGDITLEEVSPYHSHAGSFSEVTIGRYSDLRDDIIIDLTPEFSISLFSVAFGIVLILGGAYFNLRLRSTSLIFLGMFCAMVSMWSLSETRLLDIFLPNPYTVNMISYLCQLIAPLFLLLYIRYFYSLRQNKLCSVILWFGCLEISLLLLLQIAGVIELPPLLSTTHIYTVICILYVVWATIRHRKDLQKTDIRLIITAFASISICALTDIFFYSMFIFGHGFHLFDSAFFFRIGFVVFMLLMTVLSMRRIVSVLKDAAEISAYRTDRMTGMLSRHVFDEDMTLLDTEKSGMKSLGLVLFDMNNLKLINDTQGHKAGDNSIVAVSTVLNKNFSDIGRCYRIGGDEFFVVLNNIEQTAFDKLLQDFAALVTEYNRENTLEVDVAVGSEYFDKNHPDWQESIYTLFTFVDGKMYTDKRTKKGTAGRKSDIT